MTQRACRICDSDLVELYYNCHDRHDVFYLCWCGAVNPVVRPVQKRLGKFVNEWTVPPPNAVTLEEAPYRESVGGYHVNRG